MWPFYKLLPDLPKPPDQFIKFALDQIDNIPTSTDLHEVRLRYVSRNGNKFLASPGVRTLINQDWENWVKENLVSEYNDTGINWRHSNSDTGGIHTDTTRDYTLSYNITNGGPDCQVIFWQQDGHPIMRERGIQHLSFDDVKAVARMPVGPDGTWWINETRILHSAEGISEPRIQFQISLHTHQVPPEWLVD
jgi:hypothetical protein